MRLYCIFDSTAEEFGPVFEAKNDDVAVRSFKGLIKNAIQPGDFILYFLGVKTENGTIVGSPDLIMVDIYKDIEVTV